MIRLLKLEDGQYVFYRPSDRMYCIVLDDWRRGSAFAEAERAFAELDDRPEWMKKAGINGLFSTYDGCRVRLIDYDKQMIEVEGGHRYWFND